LELLRIVSRSLLQVALQFLPLPPRHQRLQSEQRQLTGVAPLVSESPLDGRPSLLDGHPVALGSRQVEVALDQRADQRRLNREIVARLRIDATIDVYRLIEL